MIQRNLRAERLEREAALERVRDLIQRNHGMVKTSQLTAAGIPYKRILSLVEQGELLRPKSGYYSLPDQDGSVEEAILSQFKDGVLTMQTALYYHGYIDERPDTWTIAISKNISKARLKLQKPPVKPYYTEEKVLGLGVEEIELIPGGRIAIYTVDRLICDVFKYRERLSPEEFRQAVRAYLSDESKDIELLLTYANARRVRSKVEAILGTWISLDSGAADLSYEMPDDSSQEELPQGDLMSEELSSSQDNPAAMERTSSQGRIMSPEEAPSKGKLAAEQVAAPQAEAETDQKASPQGEVMTERGAEVHGKPEPRHKVDDGRSAGSGQAVETAPHIGADEKHIAKDTHNTQEPEALKDVSEVTSLMFDMIRRMELIEDMSVFLRLYEILCTQTIDGMTVSRELLGICEEEDFTPDEARVKKIRGWATDRFMEQKWEKFLRHRSGLSLSWLDLMEKISVFVVPIAISMAVGQPFTGDWMPGIGRFLQ